MRRPFLIESADLRSLLGDRIEAGTGMAGFRPGPAAPDVGAAGAAGAPDRARRRPHRARAGRSALPGSTLSNAEIAHHLYLSVNTVKTHQRMIYRKLGADGRRDAVRRAKDLHIL